MIRTAGPQESVVEEARDINHMNFKFKDNEKPRSLVICAAEALKVRQCFATVIVYIVECR